jgi:hypothetical protein
MTPTVSYGADVPAWLINPFARTIMPIFLDHSYRQCVNYLGLGNLPVEQTRISTACWDNNGGALMTVTNGMEYWPGHLWQHPYRSSIHGGFGIVSRYNTDRLGNIIYLPNELIPCELDAQDIASAINFLVGWRFERWDEIEIQDSWGNQAFAITPKLVRVN